MAGLACPCPVFDGLLDSDQPKDTEVIIVEEGSSAAESTSTDTCQEARRKRRLDTSDSQLTLAAHWTVLYSLSPYFRTKIERWSREEHASKRQQQLDAHQPDQQQVDQQQALPDHDRQQQQQQVPPAYQYSMQLLVPPGQLELGRRLIITMYSSSPDLSDLATPQLVQLAALADCYEVGKVAAAVAAHLQQLSVDTMPLDTAAAVFELPVACLALPAFAVVRQTAADKLQQELGDLEMLGVDQNKYKALLSLSFEALLQLLGDERTRVAGEDTAVTLAVEWLGQHPEAVSKAPQLLGVLRLPHCSATYLTSSCVREHLMSWGVSEAQLFDLAAMPVFASEERKRWVMVAYEEQEAWHLARRPPSAMYKLQYERELKLADVKALYETFTSGDEFFDGLPAPPSLTWHGRVWRCGVYMSRAGQFGVYLGTGISRASCNVTLELLAHDSDQSTLWTLTGTYVSDMPGDPIFCHVYSNKDEGATATWAQLRRRLEADRLVHPGDTLHLTCTVSSVA